MITLVIVNVVLVVLALVFVVKEWKLTPSKIKDKVLSAMSGLGRIGGGRTVTSEMAEAKARHGQGVRLNGTLVGVVVRGEGGSIKVVNPEDAPPARPEQPKQEQRPQQNHPQQNQNNNQPSRDEQRRDERRDPRQQTRRDERRN